MLSKFNDSTIAYSSPSDYLSELLQPPIGNLQRWRSGLTMTSLILALTGVATAYGTLQLLITGLSKIPSEMKGRFPLTQLEALSSSLYSVIRSTQQALSSAKPARVKTHDYTRDIKGYHYVLEPAIESETPQFYMTSSGMEVNEGDFIVLAPEGSQPCRYKIEAIDHYDDFTGIWWTALLTPVD